MKRVVVLLESSREFGRQVIIGITRYARINGPWAFFKRPMDLKPSFPHLAGSKPDGLIMRDSPRTRELLKLNIPSILVVDDSSYPKSLPSVITDSKSIERMASTHFIEKGFRNLAFCGFDKHD